MNHFTNHRVEQTGLAAANCADDNHELSFLNLQVNLLYIQDMVKAARLKWDIVCLYLSRQHLPQPLPKSRLSLLDSLFLFLLRLLLKLVSLLFIQRGYAPAEAALDGEHAFLVVFFWFLDEASLDFGRKVEAVHSEHRFFNLEVLAVQPLDIVKATEDLAHH